MAYRRSICTRATLFARSRFNPSFSYISHDRDDNKKGNEEGNFRKNDDFSAQRRGFGTYMSNLSGPGIVFQQQSVGFGGIGNGVGGHRYMSTSIGEGVDKAEYLTDVAEVFTGGPVEAIASQAPVMSEVAIAAADSAIPVAALQYVIDYVHSFTGLSWAASIALTTLLIRGATVPFLINQLKSTSKLSIMRPRLEEIKAEMDATGDMLEGKAKMNALFREYGVTPFTPLKGMLIQGPIFISFFLAIRNMAEKVPSFKDGGAFWFTDLTTPDAMYIFPVLTAVTFLITVEFNMQEGLEGNPIAATMKKFSRGLAVLTVPFTMSFPKAIFCYWITSNIFSFAYGAVLKLPGVKQTLGVPDIPMPPPSKTQPGTKSGFSLLEALKQASASGRSTATPATPATPATAPQQKPAVSGKTSSAAILSQRLKSLERQVKQRKKAKK
ncbi:mitochondrial inner membrane protein OXA1-like [Silene latifolia]|uniref:mitochondrial inner membrane protein OXA1-like n=1 Tax=Silene latifolia TaxID=37657 RepID=UPI003D76EE01